MGIPRRPLNNHTQSNFLRLVKEQTGLSAVPCDDKITHSIAVEIS